MALVAAIEQGTRLFTSDTFGKAFRIIDEIERVGSVKRVFHGFGQFCTFLMEDKPAVIADISLP